MFVLGKRSRASLVGVHQDLVEVVERAIQITHFDFVVLEGLRTLERQKQLVLAGASKTMRSRHLTGHAVDIGALFEGKVTWRTEAYVQLAPFIKQAASEVGVQIEWGGDWTTFVDMPHWQLPWSVYPG